MKKLFLTFFIFISVFSFSQSTWTARIDTLYSTSNDTLIEMWVGLYTPQKDGISADLFYTMYYLVNDSLKQRQSRYFDIYRQNEETIPSSPPVTVQWLKDETFTNRNYIKSWINIEIDSIINHYKNR